MNTHRWKALAASLLLAFGMAAVAQEDASQPTVMVAESEEYGQYLTDSEGRALYMFVSQEFMANNPLEPQEVGEPDTAGDEPEGVSDPAAAEGLTRMTEGVSGGAVSCTGDCLEAWPPFTAEGEVTAGEGLDPDLLYTTTVGDRSQVVYNGWPLHYFARDANAGDTMGAGIESSGGVWHLVTPEGTWPGDDIGGLVGDDGETNDGETEGQTDVGDDNQEGD
jgi:predicted lipoprotein with Yx(FWY)xxD motif